MTASSGTSEPDPRPSPEPGTAPGASALEGAKKEAPLAFAVTGSTDDPVGTLRAQLGSAVDELPVLPANDPRERYGVRNLTVLWLEADKSEHTRRAYYADLADWLGWCQRTGVDPLTARRADVDAWKGTFTVIGTGGHPKPAAAATAARRLAGVSSWYRYLVSNDVADRNPVEATRRPKTGDAPP
jgi:integrase/recombinase XerD